MTLNGILRSVIFIFFITSGISQRTPYYGLPLGILQTLSNKVNGIVFAVDDSTLFIKGFSYDGQAEDAVFWAGTSDSSENDGFIIPTDVSSLLTLPSYIEDDILLILPDGKNVNSIKWLSVYNRNTSKQLGILVFPKYVQPPHPMAIGPLVNTIQGVSTGDIFILDTQTFLVQNFNYDGSKEDVCWWLSNGTKPSEFGLCLQEDRSDHLVHESWNDTVILTLPKSHFAMDYDTLSLWNTERKENYGFVDVPKNLKIPPSLRTLGKQELKMDEFNCEMLNDNLGFEVRWLIKGDDIIFHLIGNIDLSEYMALGLSKDDTQTKFDSADAVVAGLGIDGKGFATDYFFENNEKCENKHGMCPDSVHGSTDNLSLLHAERNGNTTIVIFKRRLRADDTIYDQNIYTDGPQAILWAVGPLHSDGFADSATLQSRGNLLLDFGREPHWNCPPPKEDEKLTNLSNANTLRIHCPGDHSFRAQIGSTSPSNEHKVWYINGLPRPELTVMRGNTYTFIVEGGLGPPVHHPLYITDSEEGGLVENTLEATVTSEELFAGIQQDSSTGYTPTAEGRLCDWTYSKGNSYLSIGIIEQDIKPALKLKCIPGPSGSLQWTPNANTPDVVYYQSYNERNIGGKIQVVDFCEETDTHHYLETISKGEKPTNTWKEKEELEIKNNDDEFVNYPNIQTKGKLSVREPLEKFNQEKERLKESIPAELIYENILSKNETFGLLYNALNSLRRSSEEDTDSSNEADVPERNNVSNAVLQTSSKESNYAPFPHDQSERSDAHLSHRIETRKNINRNKELFNTHSFTDDGSGKLALHSETSSAVALPKTRNFKPHFEGGFVPLVFNPMKEKEFALPKEFIYQPQPRGRPYRPFLYNESVPFHGTFKPGVPDFSGFNISHYSQDSSIIIAPNQGSTHLLSILKPPVVHKYEHTSGSTPMHLFQSYNGVPARLFQRPQDISLRHRQQNPSIIDPRKNMFPHPSINLNNKPNLPIQNLKNDDLEEVSSQRVYVSLQSSEKKKPNLNIPKRHLPPPYNTLPQTQQPRKAIYPPPIQRRPDFYTERETGLNRKNTLQMKYINQRPTPSLIQQKTNLPPRGLIGQFHVQQQSPVLNVPPKHNLQPKAEQTMMLSGQKRYTHPLQVPLRERIPQIPVQQKRIFKQAATLPMNRNVKLTLPHNRERLILQLPISNINKNLTIATKEGLKPYDLDSTPSDTLRALPVLANGKLVEIPSQNVPQKETSFFQSLKKTQKIPLNVSKNLFKDQSNIRDRSPTRNRPLPYDKKPASENVYNISLSPEDRKTLESTSGKDKILVSSDLKTMTQTALEGDVQNSQIVRNTVKNQEKNSNKSNEWEKLNIQSSKKSYHQLEETVDKLKDTKINSPHHIKTEKVADYEQSTDNSQNYDFGSSLLNYDVKDAPFGTRLKFPQNGSKIPIKILKEIPKRPVNVHKKHNLPANSRNQFSEVLTKPSEQPTTTAPIIIKGNISNSHSVSKEGSLSTKSTPKPLYYATSFSSIINQFSNETLRHQSFKSDDVKHIPIIADTLEGYIDTKYLRKNVLPTNSSSSVPLLMMPSETLENITLPQISGKPPTHDNGTDYSILNHIMTLIADPQESGKSDSSV